MTKPRNRLTPFLLLTIAALAIAYVGMAWSLRAVTRENRDLRAAIQASMIPKSAGEAGGAR